LILLDFQTGPAFAKKGTDEIAGAERPIELPHAPGSTAKRRTTFNRRIVGQIERQFGLFTSN